MPWLGLWLQINSGWVCWGGRLCSRIGHCGHSRAAGQAARQPSPPVLRALGPAVLISLSQAASFQMRGPIGWIVWSSGPFQLLHSTVKSQLIDYWEPEQLDKVERYPGFFSGQRFSRSRAKWASWSPPKRKRLSLDLFPVFWKFLWSFASQDHGQLLANLWTKQFLLVIFYHPWYSLPSSIASLISQLSEDTGLSSQGPHITTPSLEVVSRSKRSMYKIHSGICTIITLHFAHLILSQHLSCAKHYAGFMGIFVKL